MSSLDPFRCEPSNRQLWRNFQLFENEEAVAKQLRSRYETLGITDCSRAVYEATPKVIYNSIQARRYFDHAVNADLLVKPVLLYYGMVSLARVIIAFQDPHYPTSTSVLRHGLSTRKRKRDAYRFLHDDVRIQSGGIFVTLHQTVAGDPIDSQERFRIEELLARLPDMAGTLHRVGVPVVVSRPQSLNNNEWLIERTLLHGAQITRDEFLELIRAHISPDASYVSDTDPNGYVHLRIPTNMHGIHPLHRSDLHGDPWLFLPIRNHVLPEISIHFMLMFTLGMLCRYESERWCELLLTHTVHDAYVIDHFLSVAERKFPMLVIERLLSMI